MYAQFRPAGKEGDFNAYIIKSFRSKKGDKTSSVVVEKLGRLSAIAREHPGIDPKAWVEQRARELTVAEKADSQLVTVQLSPTKRIAADKKRIVHGGDIMLHPFFYELGLYAICEKIASRSKFKYDLTDIMKKLAQGDTDYGAHCKTFRTNGISYTLTHGFAPSHLWRHLSRLTESDPLIDPKFRYRTRFITYRKSPCPDYRTGRF